MLEVKNLVKVYKTKGGVETKALDGVSVNFPETGLVFLLGKSGSGKSTLLNMIGGLDRPDSGEIVVKGRSSKDFSQADFDSYRNTYIGFIFQEYNVLNEFNIEQNISLALQLQGKKNDRDAVNALLKEVDLEGFNKRKPNTLSGGQKQRIAIARALIKQPEIIMADEPTGALDSNTGKQVLETLKKLSKKKLVIIVSHDQDFAEEYGDRIIELKDGKIISDKSKEFVAPKAINDKMQIINGNIIDIKKGSALTEADFKQLYQLIKKQDKEVLISTGDDNIKVSKKAMRVSDSGHGERFSDTKNVEVKKYDGKQTKFIRSHMPFSRSFKMGASGLKTKPVRLIFTILLSVVSFTMFGVSSALMLYDENYSLSAAMEKSDRTSEAVAKQYVVSTKQVKYDTQTGQILEEGEPYDNERYGYIGANELKDLNNSNSNKFIGVFNFYNNEYDIPSDLKESFRFSDIEVEGESAKYYCYNYFHGLSDGIDDAFLSANGFRLLAGAHPTKDDEIAISNYHYELLKASGKYTGVSTADQLVGKTLTLQMRQKNYSSKKVDFKITGIYDFGAVPTTYDTLKEKLPDSMTRKQQEQLVEDYTATMSNSFYTVGYVAPSFYEKYGFIEVGYSNYIQQTYLRGYEYRSFVEKEWEVNPDNPANVYTIEDLKKSNSVTYYNINMEEVSAPIDINDDEVLLSYDQYIQSEKDYQYNQSVNSSYNVLNNIYNQAHYVPLKEFMQDVSSETYATPLGETYHRYVSSYEEWRKSGTYPDGHSIDADLATIKTGFSNLYNKAIRNYYLVLMCETIINRGLADYTFTMYVQPYYNQMTSETILEEDVATFVNNLRDFIAGDASRTWLIKNNLVDVMRNGGIPYDYFSNQIYQKVVELYGEDTQFNTLADDFRNNPTDPEAETRLTRVLDYISTDILGHDAPDYSFNPNYVPLKPFRNIWSAPDYYSKDSSGNLKHHKVKGFFSTGRDGDWIPALTRASIEKYIDGGKETERWETVYETKYKNPEDAKYAYMISPTNYSKGDIALFSLENEAGGYNYTMTNSTYRNVAMWTNTIMTLKTIFLIIGGVTGGLSALLLLNFISVSITSKNKDIGILRAVGARGSDIFKIFFSESSIIALICFLLSAIAGGITCYYINESIKELLHIGLLEYGIINVLLILGVSVVISFVATFIPVMIASKKPPVEAIRAL